MQVEEMEAQLKRNMDALEKIFYKHENLLEKLSSMISKYIEISDIVKPLVEAAGAEIESKGRASKRTVFGRSGFRGRTGKGIVQYLAEKTWILANLIRFVSIERAESSQEARYIYSTLRGEKIEEKAEKEEKDEKLARKMKKVEAITRKCEKILSKEASRDKRLLKITYREIKALREAYHLSFREGILARKLTRLVGASRALKLLEISFTKEEIFFSKFMKEENWVVDTISKELIDIFKLMKENNKIEKIVGGSIFFAGDEREAKKEEKVSKRIKKLMKSLRKIQGHIKKIKKGAAKFGVKIEKSVSLLNSREREILKAEEVEEKDLNEIDKLLENLREFSLMISRFENSIILSESGLEPQIRWINNAFITAYKISKKNPSGVSAFLSKVSDFAQKSLIPQLRKIDEERRSLFKEFTSEDGIVKSLNRSMDIFSKFDKLFNKELNDMEVGLVKIEKNVYAGNKRAIADLSKDVKELERSLREERKMTANEKLETKAKISELKNRIAEIKSKFKDMKHEFDPAISEFKKALKSVPEFRFLKKGLFTGSLMSKLIGNIETAEHYLEAEENEDSNEIKSLEEWISNNYNVEYYIIFLQTLFKSFMDEELLLNRMIYFYKELSMYENEFLEDVEKAERMMNDLDRAIINIDQVMAKYPDMFGEEERDIFNELRETYNNSRNLLSELEKTGNLLFTLSHNLPQMISADERAREHLIKLNELIKESIKSVKKLKKLSKSFQ